MASQLDFRVKRGLFVSEIANVAGNTAIGGTLSVTGAAALSNTISVTGAATLSNTLAVTGTSQHTGAATFANTVGVTGAATLSNTINVTGAATLSNTLAVTGTSTYTGAATFANTVGVTGAATLSNTVAITGATTVANNITVTGVANVSSQLNVGANVGLSTTTLAIGNSTVNTVITSSTIGGNATAIFGNTTINGVATINGNTVITGNLTVTGTTTYVNTATLNISDNIITLNADVGAIAPTENAGIEVNRGTSANTSLRWNETTDVWEASNNTGVFAQVHYGGTGATSTTSTNAGGSIIQDFAATIDSFGHITALTKSTANLDTRYLSFQTVVAGNTSQANVVADAYNDVLTFANSAGIDITTNAATDTVTFAHTDTSSYANLAAAYAGGTVINGLSANVDTFGHVVNLTVATANLDVRYDARYLGFQNVATQDVIAYVSGTTTLNSNVVAVTSASTYFPTGRIIRSASFPWGTTVASSNATHFIATANATATGTSSIGSANAVGTVVADAYNDSVSFIGNNAIIITTDPSNDEIVFDTQVANTSASGTITLLDSISNTSIATYAPTANSVKTAYDAAIVANTRAYLCALKAGDTFTGTVNVGSNVVITTASITVGNSTVNTVHSATNISGNPISGLGNTTITGFANVTSTLQVGGAVTISNTISHGNTTITGFANVTSTLQVGGAVTISNTISHGNTTITGFANVSSTLQVGGAASLTSATYTGAVSGITTLAAGNTTVTGFANVTSTLQVGGAATLSSTIGVTGAATFSNTMSVTGLITGTITSANVATYVSATQQVNVITSVSSSMAMSQDSGATKGGLVVKATGTGDANLAGMTFWNDAYAIKLGVRADGYIGMGGWSRPAWSWYSDPSGNMTAAGNVTAYSDPRLKEKFVRIEKPLEVLGQLDGGSFYWKQGYQHTAVKAGKRDYGVLADQVEAVMPEIVTESIEIDGERYKTVAYEKLVPLLIEAIKELKAEVDELKGKVNGN